MSNSNEKKYKISKNACKYCGLLISWDVKIDGRFPTHVNKDGTIRGDGGCPNFQRKRKNTDKAESAISKQNEDLKGSGIITEFFLIDESIIPPLYKYNLQTTHGATLQEIGGALKYKMKNYFRGTWYDEIGVVVGDKKIDQGDLDEFLKTVWNEESPLINLKNIIPSPSDYTPTPKGKAKYILEKMKSECKGQVKSYLNNNIQMTRDVKISLIWKPRAWDINGIPAISISLKFSMQMRKTIADMLDEEKLSPNQIIGWQVGDINGPTSGLITEFNGKLGENRSRLLKYELKPATKEAIINAPDSEPVFLLKTRSKPLEYIASCFKSFQIQ